MCQIILVDESDNQIGCAEKMEAHVKGLLHRAFSIFVFRRNTQLELLIQRRSEEKYHCAGLWTNTCCSHPRPNSDLFLDATNRLEEEMGFTCKLNYLDKFIYHANLKNALIEHELDYVLATILPMNLSPTIKINTKEVCDYQWINLEKLEMWLNETPLSFTPWFQTAYSICKNKINMNNPNEEI